MTLPNKLGLSNQVELAKAEERLSKQRAKELFDSDAIDSIAIGTFAGLAAIHTYLFDAIYEFSGKIRTVNLAKGNFRFAPLMYLEASLQHIDAMPHDDFDAIVAKYVEMNIAHPFREGNGRATRIWLDCMLKSALAQIVDWNQIDKEAYLSAMERSVINDCEIKTLLRAALTDEINNHALLMRNIDVSYYYEGYSAFKAEDV